LVDGYIKKIAQTGFLYKVITNSEQNDIWITKSLLAVKNSIFKMVGAVWIYLL